jgi:hypothetical protein
VLWSSRSAKPPSTRLPTRYSGCPPCPASARGSASGCSLLSLRSTAAPASRRLSPLAGWSQVPNHRQGNVWSPPAPRAARPSCSGPLLQPLACASETLQQRRHPSPAWSTNMPQGTPAPCGPHRWPVPSMIGSPARWLAIRRRSSNDQGGERLRLRPHGTTQGCTCQRRSSVRHARRPCTPKCLEVTRPGARRLCLALRSRSGFWRRLAPTAGACCSSPAPGSHWTTSTRCARSMPRTGGGNGDIIDQFLDIDLHHWTPVRGWKMGCHQFTTASHATTLESNKSARQSPGLARQSGQRAGHAGQAGGGGGQGV